jgi:YHS domain-containing protein
VIGWLLRLIVIYLVIRGLSRLLRGVQQGLSAPPQERKPSAVGLVRDPVCGTFVVPSRALTLGTGAGVRHFCSEECRRAYLAKAAS